MPIAVIVSRRSPGCRLLVALVAGGLLTVLLQATVAEAKRKPAPQVEPDLRIVAVTVTPVPYSPSAGSLDLAIEVQLPKDLDGASILEVSSLISSPSKRSLRFLSSRQPVEIQNVAESPGTPPFRINVVLTWDGTDQANQQVDNGRYQYEVRAKLLTVTEQGPRTQTVSWPKRGILEVREKRDE